MSRPPDDLKPLPKPVRLEVPRGEPEKKREKPTREPPKKIPPANKSLRYFEQAQRSHGHRRPPAKKPVKKRASFRYGKEVGIACLLLICVGALVLSIMLLTRDNALAVYLNDSRVGYFPLNRETREWEAAYVQEKAVAHRAASVAAEIQVNERVSLQSVRTNRQNLTNATITETISAISHGFTYRIVATAIYVDGQRIAVLRALNLAEFVARHFIGAYETLDTVQATILGWELRTMVVDDGSALHTPEYALSQLDRQIETTIPYVVRDGDVKGAIATRNGISLNRLLEDNNLAFDAIIRPGDVLNIRTTRPFLTVRTVNELTRSEIIPMEVITQYNDELALGTVNILAEGREGERSLVVRTTYENGVFISEEIITDIILVHAETRMEEVGTSPTAVPQWR